MTVTKADRELLLRVSGGLDSDASGIDPESEICWTPTISLTVAEMRTIARVLREAAEAKMGRYDFMRRVAEFFDADLTAGSFLREDGDGGFIGGMHRMAREIDRLREDAGTMRMCLTCGRMVDAATFKRGDELPECRDAQGWAGCSFDLTPKEAWQHWSKLAHERSAALASRDKEIERLTEEVERLKTEADGQFVEAAIRVMRAYPGFNARDYAEDGISADDFEMFFTEDMNEAWRCYEREKALAATATRERDEARAECERLREVGPEVGRLLNDLETDANGMVQWTEIAKLQDAIRARIAALEEEAGR